MGRTYVFECARCGYKAHVSGKADRGSGFCVQTIACRDCKALYDVVVRLRVPDDSPISAWRNVSAPKRLKPLSHRKSPEVAPSFQAALNRLAFTGVRRFRWIDYRIRCPVSPFHHAHLWSEPGKCPKCSLYLEKSALPYRIWD